MPDIFTNEKRRALMARVRGYDTKPEKQVRSLLHGMGYRFRLYRRDLPGNPDIVLPKHKKIILVHGCFWHGHQGCRRAARPSSNAELWNKKIDRNMERDTEVMRKLCELGWSVLIIWQCQLKDRAALMREVERFLQGDAEGLGPDGCS